MDGLMVLEEFGLAVNFTLLIYMLVNDESAVGQALGMLLMLQGS